VTNREKLQKQSRWLSRTLGALRPYIERFDQAWQMQLPGTAGKLDVLEAAMSPRRRDLNTFRRGAACGPLTKPRKFRMIHANPFDLA
jgi:hypothetical protein